MFNCFIESTIITLNTSATTKKEQMPSSFSMCSFIQNKYIALECPFLDNEDIEDSIDPCYLEIDKEHDAPYRSFRKILKPKISGLCLE